MKIVDIVILLDIVFVICAVSIIVGWAREYKKCL